MGSMFHGYPLKSKLMTEERMKPLRAYKNETVQDSNQIIDFDNNLKKFKNWSKKSNLIKSESSYVGFNKHQDIINRK